MNESVGNEKAPQAYIERAIGTDEDFLAELDAADTLEALREVLHDQAFVTDIDGERCSVLPEITGIPGSEDADVQVYLEDDIVRSIGVFITDPVTDLSDLEQEVRNWIPHRDIANAVIRIITKTHNEKEAA
jgi:hypothetical protein